MGENRLPELKSLVKEQLGRLERLGIGSGTAHVANALQPGELVEELFGGQVDGKGALIALTNERVLVGYGFLPRCETVPYDAITQVSTGLASVRISGSGVDIEIKAIPRGDVLQASLASRRAAAKTSSEDPAGGEVAGDAALLAKLAELQAAGVISDEEFAEKKAEILARM